MTIPSTVTSSDPETQLVFPHPQKHAQRTSIQHWQLRDLIAFPSKDKNEILAVYQSHVVLYNTLKKSASYPVRDLGFSPTSVAAGCGYVAVGGQRSQVTVRQLNSNWQAHTSIGGAINNSLHISEHAGDVRLLVCNNDETIKIFSLPSMEMAASIPFPTAVNYAAVSPDGRKMVAVGDSNQVHLFDISVSGGYRNVATLTSSEDAGFSCAWDHSSEKFAVACQDGYVCVWDIRSSNKLAQIASIQRNQKGACRCVKFSPSGSMDLIAFTEHVSYVNVVDSRTFESHQTIRVSPPNIDMHISGLAFTPDSQSIFVGLENNLLEYDIDTMSRRTFPTGAII